MNINSINELAVVANRKLLIEILANSVVVAWTHMDLFKNDVLVEGNQKLPLFQVSRDRNRQKPILNAQIELEISKVLITTPIQVKCDGLWIVFW